MIQVSDIEVGDILYTKYKVHLHGFYQSETIRHYLILEKTPRTIEYWSEDSPGIRFKCFVLLDKTIENLDIPLDWDMDCWSLIKCH